MCARGRVMSALSVSIARSASASSFQSSSLGSAEVQTCFVCCNDIIERTDLGEGDDAIFCEGSHQQWAHAHCVGVNAALYQALSTSGDTWQCPTCATTTSGVGSCFPAGGLTWSEIIGAGSGPAMDSS